jgi:hypothetical protein
LAGLCLAASQTGGNELKIPRATKRRSGTNGGAPNHGAGRSQIRIPGAAFPGRLLLKPVSTTRLVLLPMVFGGGVVVTIFAIWTELVLRHLFEIPASSLFWINTVLLSFFWWMQALAWGIPILKGRVLIDLVVAVIHLLVGLTPLMPVSALSRWQWPILVGLLVSAYPPHGSG